MTFRLSKKTRQKYRTPERDYKRMNRRSTTLLEWTLLSVSLTAICSYSDYATMLDVLDEMLSQGEWINMLVTFTIAVVENTLPLLLVYLWLKHRYQPNRYSIWPVILLLLSLILLFVYLFYLRWMSVPFTFDMVGVAPEDYETREKANRAAAMLLGTVPVITSVANGALFYISPTVYDKRQEALKLRIFSLRQQLLETQASISVLRDRETLYTRLMEEDAKAYAGKAAEQQAAIVHKQEYAKIKLAAVLHDADALSWMGANRKKMLP